eukprot:comp19522_c0_seq1/m.22838 comp19522_c0_seq1/g.22838  ORF comp19522_c0_seq1/g.22838 comp19522_c0_seq1/m.22838 type:complete len:658 (-) comp19522_c0_seq1:292-2265(-)
MGPIRDGLARLGWLTLFVGMAYAGLLPSRQIAINTKNYAEQETLVNRSVTVLEAVGKGMTAEFVRAWVNLTVLSDEKVFGAAVAFEPRPGFLPRNPETKKNLNPYFFAPYVSRPVSPDGKVLREGDMDYVDLGTAYNYSDAQWYQTPRQQFYSKRTRAEKSTVGYWTMAYFDDGGGNIWMVTYSRPFMMSADNETMRGITTMDISLDDIDINMCLPGRKNLCKEEYPTCNHIKGQGQVQTAYTCCMEGCLNCVLPNVSLSLSTVYRNGNYCKEADKANNYVIYKNKSVPSEEFLSYDYNQSIRFPIFLSYAVSMVMVACVLAWVFSQRKWQVIKLATPNFIYLELSGAMLSLLYGLLAYITPSKALCIVQNWLAEIGFVLMLGTMVIKKWRLFVIYVIKRNSEVAPNFSDDRMMRHFMMLLAFFAFVLGLWTAMDGMGVAVREEDEVFNLGGDNNTLTIRTQSLYCSKSVWVYILLGLETAVLVLGVLFSFAVRKTPSAFHESQFLAIAIFVQLIIDTCVQVFLLTRSKTQMNPDLEYIVLSVRYLGGTVVNVCLNMVPKMVIISQNRGNDVDVKKHQHDGDSDDEAGWSLDEDFYTPETLAYKAKLDSLRMAYDTLLTNYNNLRFQSMTKLKAPPSAIVHDSSTLVIGSESTQSLT